MSWLVRCLTWFTLITSLLSLVYDTTRVTSPGLPWAALGQAIGYDSSKDEVLILGGAQRPYRMVTFKNNAFSDDTSDVLSNMVFSVVGQSYTQLGIDLWMINVTGDTFIKFNTQTRAITSPSTSSPESLRPSYGCLASIDNGINEYILSSDNTGLQIYDIGADQWLNSVITMPTMKGEPRDRSSCIVHNDRLYVIGGYGTSDLFDAQSIDVGMTDLSDIENEEWQYVNGTLSGAGFGIRSAGYGDEIILIGGDSTDVHVINTLNNELRVAGTVQYEGMESAAVIIVNDMLYAFGGMTSSGWPGTTDWHWICLSCTPNPTYTPTLNPTPNTASPTGTTSITTSVTSVISSQFSTSSVLEDVCDIIYFVEEELNEEDFNLSDMIFEIDYNYSYYLSWSVDPKEYNNVTYRLYYNNLSYYAWTLQMDNIQYIYIDNITTVTKYSLPPLEQSTSWYFLMNDNGDYNTNNSLQLYLSCTPPDSDTDSDTDSDDHDSPSETALEYTAYILVAIIFGIGLLLIIIAYIFHRKKKGSDRPGYVSIIRCCIEIADLYTDISFAWSLYLNGNALLWYFLPLLLILFTYILSAFTALWKINVYKRSKNAAICGYMKQFDKPWLILVLIFGFYATFQLFTSHLFHLGITSFQATKSEKMNIKTLRILNFVLIENCGMIIIQFMYLTHVAYFDGIYDGDVPTEIKLTLLSMTFSVLSIISGILTIISRCLYCCSSLNSSSHIEHFYLDISSKDINKKHLHSHFLISLALNKALKIDKTSIETLTIIQKSKGIHCKIGVNICNNHDMENFDALFSSLSSLTTKNVKKSLKQELKNLLKLKKIKSIEVQKVKEDDQANKKNVELNIMNLVENKPKSKSKSKSQSGEIKNKSNNKKKKKKNIK